MTVKVIHWGLGAMGGGMVKLLGSKTGAESVAAIDVDPNKQGKTLNELFGVASNAKVVNNAAEALKADADLVIVATGSFTEEVYPQLVQAIEAKKNVICIAEEMAYPQQQQPELAEKIDKLARENNVSVLGTGINPGFVLDLLIVAMTGVCYNVTEIKAARINDLSPFGPTVMRTQGVGISPEEFKAGVEAGTVVGHVGFPESMAMVAKALGWELDEIKQTKEPIISKTHRETPHVKVAPGMVAGCKHIAYGIKDGKTLITMEHPQQVRPEAEGVDTGDYIWIKGEPDVNLAIKPEIPGGIGTIAVAVNSIPNVINAPAGLVSMIDLPLPPAILGDIRQLIKR
ncbi:MAG: NADP-binding protein [Firmicutes bacterium]|nr:NADP-binding protein [Bacillota bacterium]